MSTAPRLEPITWPTGLVPGPVPGHLILPPAAGGGARLPLIVALHGGDGGDGFAELLAFPLATAWQLGVLPPCLVAVPRSGRSFWIDRRDGSQRWETFLHAELLPALRARPDVDAARKPLLTGISMGGLGALRLAFRHPADFTAVAAVEPGLDRAIAYADLDLAASWFRDEALYRQFFGDPIDPAHYAASNPTALAGSNRDAIVAADLQIRIECGDEDSLGLHDAVAFLHAELERLRIRHEYHSVRGADHLGRSLYWRFVDTLEFLGRTLRRHEPDPAVEALRRMVRESAGYAGLKRVIDGGD